jgi:hypothetical protein
MARRKVKKFKRIPEGTCFRWRPYGSVAKKVGENRFQYEGDPKRRKATPREMQRVAQTIRCPVELQGLGAARRIKPCNRKHFATRFNEGRRACNQIQKDLQPLCRHILNLARDTVKRVGKGELPTSYCKGAGTEISQAIRLAKKHPRR